MKWTIAVATQKTTGNHCTE